MPIDTSIYSQIRAPEQVNPLARYAQIQQIQNAQGQNRLAEMMFAEKEREINENRLVGEAYRGALGAEGKLDRSALMRSIAERGMGARIPGLQKSFLESDEAQGKVDKQRSELIDAKLKQSRNFLETVTTPEQYIAWHEGNHQDPILGPALAARGVTADKARASIVEALKTPGGFEELLNKSRVGIEKFTEMNKPTFQTRNLGGTTETLQIPGMGGTPQTISSLRNTPSPGERMADARARERLDFERGVATADAGGPNQAALSKRYGKPSPGFRWKDDGSMEAIPGGPADIKTGAEGEKRAKRQEILTSQADAVLDTVKEAKKMTGLRTAGAGGLLSSIPTTEARKLAGHIETIKANLGFDRLQQMRDMSPTGGALGQVAVQELVSLQSTVAKLDQLQKPSDVVKALDKIEKHYIKWKETLGGSTGGATGDFSPVDLDSMPSGKKVKVVNYGELK